MSNIERHHPTKVRSPSYPGVGLATAVERAEQLYDHENRHAAPVPAVLQHWGYSPKSGPGFSTLAAVKQFGLIDDEGRGDARRVRLSDLGLRIAQDKRTGSVERLGAIREAALRPTAYAELWRAFGDGASDENMAHHLVTLGFPFPVARDVVEDYRASLAFAHLPSDDNGSVEGDPDEDAEDHDDHDDGQGQGNRGSEGRRRLARPGMKSYAIPVDRDNDAIIELPIPMTSERWENFKAFLTAMERVILDDSHPDEP